MDSDILIVLRGFLQIAWNFWPVLAFITVGLIVSLVWERLDRK
jgi:hypothetical protein